MGAISAKNGSISIMPSADSEDGQQLLHSGGGWDVDNHAFAYKISVDEDSTYYLVANFSTWHMNRDLFLTTGASSDEIKIPVFWSHGHWMETQPVELKLLKGDNVLRFSRYTDLGMALKEFFLFKAAPVVPTPDPHDLPVPSPPPTPLSDTSSSQTGHLARKTGFLNFPQNSVKLLALSLDTRIPVRETDHRRGQGASCWQVGHGLAIAITTAMQQEMDLI